MSTLSPGGWVERASLGSAIPRYMSTVAYGFLGATWLSVGLGIGFFVYGGIFAPLSDAGALLVSILLWFLVGALYSRTRDDRAATGVFWIGAVAVLASGFGALGLIVGNLLFPTAGWGGFLGLQFLGILLQGAWLLGIGYVGLRSQAVRGRTAWAGIVAGLGMAVGIVALTYSYAVGTFSLAVTLSGLLYVVGISLFAVWLAGEFRAESARPVPT